MTFKQKKALDFIRAYIAEHGVAPTIQGVADGLEMTSRSGAHRLVMELAAQGLIIYREGHARGISLPDSGADRIFEAITDAHAIDDGDGPMIVCTPEELRDTLRKVMG